MSTNKFSANQHVFQLIRFRPWAWLGDVISFGARLLLIPVSGLVIQAFFNNLLGEPGFQLNIWQAAGAYLLQSIFAGLALMSGIYAFVIYRYDNMALLTRNLFARILEQPGSMPLPQEPDGTRQSSGQALSTFRDDTDHATEMMVLYVDIFAFGFSAVVSIYIMLRINWLVTAGALLPLSVIIIVAQLLSSRIKRYRERSRAATSKVTGIIGDMFNGVQALKVAHAEDRIIERFAQLNDERRDSMVIDQFFRQLIETLSSSTTAIGTGLVLLFAAQAMFSGEFTIGDFALFVAYLWPVVQWMRTIGGAMAHYRQTEVSFQRMETLMQDAPPQRVSEHHEIYRTQDLPSAATPSKTDAHRLENLSVRGLTYLYPTSAAHGLAARGLADHNGPHNGILAKNVVEKSLADGIPANDTETNDTETNDTETNDTETNDTETNDTGTNGTQGSQLVPSAPPTVDLGKPNGETPGANGIHNIDLDLPRGSFTVIVGRIGSGKTTLLKALLGLLPAQAGQIQWNGQPVDDPANFLIPPRSAYTPQVPRLFSESLRDNILMGLSNEQEQLAGAIHTAVMEHDLEGMGEGLDTLIGSHGVRLSGGQAQRSAAGRMFVRDAELLVFDDLSSALDVETERLLWERVFAERVSKEGKHQIHPPALWYRIGAECCAELTRLSSSKMAASMIGGTLAELLERSDEMREIVPEGL